MTTKPISRRNFIKISGVILGGAALVGTGLIDLDTPQTAIDLPEYHFGENKMSNKILVTYASRHGSTVGVAEAIGKALAEGGAAVDVLPVQEVKDLESYGAVVAGSAIQGGEWLPEAMQFVQTHQAELSRKPFAAFLVCMTMTMKDAEKYRSGISGWLEPVRTLVKPASEGLFAGALDINKIPSFGDRLKFKLSVLFGVWTEGDHRDWKAIRQWAKSLQPLLLG
jgi:menaquinone-dependent protoporphyrinogen oxidase